MSGANLIFMLQCFVAFAWGVPLIRKWTAVRRVWAGRSHGDDLPRAVIWFIAAAIEIGILRWLLFPQSIRTMSSAEIFSWAGVYVLWIVAAGAVTLVYWERSHG
jgi:hypothetical protein